MSGKDVYDIVDTYNDAIDYIKRQIKFDKPSFEEGSGSIDEDRSGILLPTAPDDLAGGLLIDKTHKFWDFYRIIPIDHLNVVNKEYDVEPINNL